MSAITQIAKEEWRYWSRSRLVLICLVVISLLIAVSAFLTASDISEAQREREHHQSHAEETFKSQPDRHPHRMVHYGHYAFRTPSALAIFDPGVDAVTGQSIFLEGHHQNTAMFSDDRAMARTGGFGSLSAAKVYKLFVPLLLIAIGYGVLIRERENRTLGTMLAQGTTGVQIIAGKGVALMSVGLLLSVPALCLTLYAITRGESAIVGLWMYLGYLLFLAVWVALILFVSVQVTTRGLALGVLLTVWFVSSLIIPRLGVANTSALVHTDGKFQTDIKMMKDIRALGNGHNASDPAFAKLKADILEQYKVETIEDLPFNYRGLLAGVSEKNLTDLMNKYAEERMSQELKQSQFIRNLSYISPFVAIDYTSRHLAGTDIHMHHRFLREAEDLRFDFVQKLNQAHQDQLAYDLDVNRNKTEETFDSARVSADNWKGLDDFRFTSDPAGLRVTRAILPLSALTIWLVLLLFITFNKSRKIAP